MYLALARSAIACLLRQALRGSGGRGGGRRGCGGGGGGLSAVFRKNVFENILSRYEKPKSVVFGSWKRFKNRDFVYAFSSEIPPL